MGDVIGLLGGGVFGSVLGGVFRLVPEAFKFFDRKDERKHELAMFDRQCELEKLRGDQKLQEIGAQRDATVDSGVVDAFKLAIEQQTEMVKASGGKLAALSASVRPVMTYYLLVIYGIVKTAMFTLMVSSGQPIAQTIVSLWSPEDMALLCGVINYWILDRSLTKRGLA